MPIKYIAVIVFAAISSLAVAQNSPDAIVGKWEAVPQKNVIVEVYKDQSEYKARVVWFNDNDDKTKPMNVRQDDNNVDPSLRKRRILGLQVLNNMIYNSKNNKWENGKIYDAKSGRTWNSSAWITNNNTLQVRGFWHLEFIGQNMTFKKIG
ncbi:DUF2147 domain-containing protein [Segetibacter koreensis]|uniref:DUF2147 domain-containing protein n=1 Tax=Segetibacter koreensis TaxID=398037 RepID=UPI0003828196|nr:DUF2147 domain-containing protein [Segetibacter koreensis]